MKKLIAILSIVAVLICGFVVPAAALVPKAASPSTMLMAASEKTGVPATVKDMVEAKIITNAEKRLIEKNGVITRAVAYRVLLPVYGIYPYPAEFYPDIKPASQCVGNYANARCAAITLGLATEKQNPIQVISAAELNALIKALDDGLTLPEIKTDIPYLQGIEWNLSNYEGRNAMMAAYSSIPAAWFTDYDAQGWSFKYELPKKDKPQTENRITAGSTSYKDKIIRIGHSDERVLPHEMTHYIIVRAKITQKQLYVTYNTDHKAMKDILGDYSQTKAGEYVPEFMAYWLLHPELHTELRSRAPLSAKLAETLADWTP